MLLRLFIISIVLTAIVQPAKAWTGYKGIPSEHEQDSIEVYIQYADAHFKKNDFIGAMEYYHRSINLMTFYQQQNKKLAYAYYQLGLCYSYFDYHEFSLEEFKNAAIQYQNLNDSIGLAYSWLQIGDEYEDDGNYTEAMKWLQKSLVIFLQYKEQKGIALCYDNIGSIYEDNGDLNKAFDYIRRSYFIFSTLKDSVYISQEMNNLADVYRRKNQTDSALYYYNTSLDICERIHFVDGIRSNSKDLAKTYYLLENYKKAYDMFISYHQINQNLKIEHKLDEITRLGIKSIKDQKDLEIKILEKEAENSSLRQILLLSASILLLIIIFIIYQYYSLRIKKNKEIEEGKSRILQIELENSKLEHLKLEKELELKQQTLSDYMKLLSEKVKMIEEFNQSVEISAPVERNTEQLIEVIDELSQLSILTEEDWDIFKKKFEDVYEGFFTRLKHHYPDLTTGDLRMSALIKLNLSSKEIAHMTGISVESVKKAKSRLKKRVIADPVQKLSDWIKSF